MKNSIALALFLAARGACAGQEATRTGFLSTYDKMQPTKDHPSDLICVNPTYAPANFTKAESEPVAWRPAEGAPQRDATVNKHLQDELQKSLIEVLAKKYSVMNAPDGGSSSEAGTLRVRSAITSTRRANWYINAPSMLVGLPPPNPGGASVEIEVLDQASGQVLVSLATYANGMPWNIVGYYQQFGRARRAFALASELLVAQLQPKDKSVAAGSH